MHRLAFFAALCLPLLPLAAADATDTGGGDDTIKVANLIYAGTRSSVCFSERFLTIVARKSSIETARKFKAVKLAGDELFRFPFAIMTGEGAFTLTETERVNLKRYLEQGGFLLASAGCSSKPWHTSFRREMRLLYPERELEDIPPEHEIFRTIFTIEKLQTHSGQTRLQGLSMGGKIVLLYSKDGLNDTHSLHGCCCCGGSEIKKPHQLNANILAYALVQ